MLNFNTTEQIITYNNKKSFKLFQGSILVFIWVPWVSQKSTDAPD